MCGTVGSKYFTIDEDMIAHRLIIEGTEVAGTDHEILGPFTNAYISDRKNYGTSCAQYFSRVRLGINVRLVRSNVMLGLLLK